MSSYQQTPDDFDSFIDFNGGFDASNFAEEQQTFSGPSHAYDQFRQQTGLPTGVMSNVSAYNDVNMDTDFTSPPDFNRPMGPSDMTSYDFNQASRPPTYPQFYPQTSNMDEYVNPTTVDPSRPVRIFPGMHTQAAEQARAMAQQQRQQQSHHMLRTRQQSLSEQSHSDLKGKGRATSQPAHDIVADRRISQILDNMRHQSAMSTIDEDADSPNDAAARAKREEEEMDEDERLLASEEGKKLSSKERRQLRNKVSARAFRSRRKEYISQLEGDLAKQATDTGELKMMNRKLLEENTQLKNLTRTLLSHPSFRTFLDEMSHNPTFIAGPAPQHLQMPVETLPSQPSNGQPIKQEAEQQQQQGDMQINMARMPEHSLDLSMLNLGNSQQWPSSQQQGNGFQYQQPRVFALHELPQGPSREEMRGSAAYSFASLNRQLDERLAL